MTNRGELSHKLPQGRRTVRIVRDPRDATRDYFVSEARADELYRAGRLDLVALRAEGWTYVTQRGEYVA